MHKKTKIIAYTTFFITALCLGVYVFFIYTVNKKDEQLLALIKNVSTLRELSLNDVESKKTALIVDGIKQKIDSHFLTQEESISFLEYLESLGTSDNVVVSINSAEIPAKKSILKVSFTIKGPFSGVYKTLLKIESMPYLSILRDVSMTALPEDPITKKVAWQVDGTVEIISFDIQK